jgi:O-acetyl-ADP-ribose deacetylase (regulator of RNase III)
MGRKKKVDSEAVSAPEAASNGTPEIKTKADAFRAAVAQGIESPKAISEYVKTTYGMEMSAGMVSAYKSLEKNKGKTKGLSTPKTAKAPKAVTVAHPGIGTGVMAQFEAIKGLVKDLGAD